MVGVSVWASSVIGIGTSIEDLFTNPTAGNNPWLVATLFDAYFGFLWFWIWIVFRETSAAISLLWLALLLCLGNIAMAVYVLLALRKLPGNAAIESLVSPEKR